MNNRSSNGLALVPKGELRASKPTSSFTVTIKCLLRPSSLDGYGSIQAGYWLDKQGTESGTGASAF